MQVSATLIAAQQAAREARARLHVPQAPAQAAGATNFAAALEKTSGVKEAIAPLRLREAPGPAPAAQPKAAAPARLGQHIDITV